MGVMGGAPFLGPALCRSPVCRAGTEKERVPLRIWIVWCGSAAPMCGKPRRNRAGKPRLSALPRSGRAALRTETARAGGGMYLLTRSGGTQPPECGNHPRFRRACLGSRCVGGGKTHGSGVWLSCVIFGKGCPRFGCRWYSPQWQPAQVLQLCVQPEAGGSPVISVIIAPLT